MTSAKTYSLEIANPIYPRTNAFGSIVAPGTQPTKIVRLKTEDFIRDFNFEACATGRISLGSFTYSAEIAGVDAKELRAEVIAFAKGGAL